MGGTEQSYKVIRLGPESRAIGRNYGLRSSPVGLATSEREILQCLAEAISGWSQQPGARDVRDFTLLKALPGQGRHLLLRAANLGLGSMGTVAAGHGLLIEPEAMTALGFHAERLLHAIPPVTAVEWGAEEIDVAPSSVLPAFADLDGERLRERGQVQIAVPAGELDDAAVQHLLAALEIDRMSEATEWTTCTTLSPIYKFDPECFAIRLRPMLAGDVGDASDDFVFSAGAISVRSGTIRRGAWSWLFAPRDDEAELATAARQARMVVPELPAALRQSLADVRWREGHGALKPEVAVAASIQDATAPARSGDDIFALLVRLALRARSIPDEAERRVAAAGLSAYFANADARGKSFAALLDGWTGQVWPLLDELLESPLRMAVERDSLSHMAPGTVRALLDGTQRGEVLTLAGQWLDRLPVKPGRAETAVMLPLLERLVEWSGGAAPREATALLLRTFLAATLPLADSAAALLDRAAAVLLHEARADGDFARLWHLTLARANLRWRAAATLPGTLAPELKRLRVRAAARKLLALRGPVPRETERIEAVALLHWFIIEATPRHG